MIRGRIAPTPNGYLHTGNAVNFVITWLWVRREKGILRLRLDDRSTPDVKDEHLNEIFETLRWMGMDWDEGPQTPEEQKRIYSQHLHNQEYIQQLEGLVSTGQVYACTCPRRELHSPVVSCTCRTKGIPLYPSSGAGGPGVTWRIITPENQPVTINDVSGQITVDLFKDLHDFSLRRRDGVASYQVVSLVDDLQHQTNLIIRGTDLIPSTAAQLFLAKLIGNESFGQTTFYHHPLLKDEGGEKLSKSAKSEAVQPQWKEAENFYRWMSKTLGWKEEASSLKEMLQMVNAGATLLLPE